MTRIKKTLKVSFPSLIIRRPVQKKVTLTMLWNKSYYVAKEGACICLHTVSEMLIWQCGQYPISPLSILLVRLLGGKLFLDFRHYFQLYENN